MFNQIKIGFFLLLLLLICNFAYGEDICQKECDCYEFSATKLGATIPLIPPGVVICGAWPDSKGKEFIYRVRPPEGPEAPYYYIGRDLTRDYYIVATPEGIIRYGGNHLQELVNNITFNKDYKRVVSYSVLRGNLFFIPGNDVAGDTEPFTVIDGIPHKNKDLQKKIEEEKKYCSNNKNKWVQEIGNRYIVNGHKGKIYDWIGDFIFSQNCESFAYLAIKNSELFVVFNGKEQKHYRCLHIEEGEAVYDTSEIDNLVFSPDSKKIAYVVDITPHPWNDAGDFQVFVVNNTETTIGRVYIDEIFFSDDSNRVAYMARNAEDGSVWIVVDGKKGKAYASYKDVDAFIFSHDSKSFAYIAKDSGKESVVINGKELDKYDDVGEIKFLEQKIVYSAKSGNAWSLVVHDINTGVSSLILEKVPFVFSIIRGGHETSYRLELENSHILIYMNDVKLY